MYRTLLASLSASALATSSLACTNTTAHFEPDAGDAAPGPSRDADAHDHDSGSARDVGADTKEAASHDAPGTTDTGKGGPADAAVDAPTMLDLHDAILFDNPSNLADWAVTTTITDVEFQYMGTDGVHVTFDKQDGPGSWPDVTPPGWSGSLEYTLGFAEYIGGQWYASAAIQFWRGLPASGGNVAQDVPTGGQCSTFGYGSTCQVAQNWYYDSRWGNLAGYQPKTGEMIGVFVVAGNVRGVTDGSQSPVQERSNVVLVPMPDLSGAQYTF